mmetsp:Transcript_7837/g.9460  ORF Transcript_7837/g.9460 Transcript_7837/m.9460 type:complete len:101 (-) Transcript_7837:1005-1307(-)
MKNVEVTPDKCPFMPERKNKACRKALWKRPDGTKSAYCVVHAHKDTPNMEYVACPHEPKNIMPKAFLEHHLKVCPKFMQTSKIEAQPFFKRAINFFCQED